MILACARLNWQIHLHDPLITDAHESERSAGEPEPWEQQSGRAQAALAALRNRLSSMFLHHMIGRPKRSQRAKNSDVTWCYNHRAGITLFGSTAVATRNKLLDTPVGGFLHQFDVMTRMFRLRPVVRMER
ncbi:hypothetical protein [Caballeronia calidae]|uniref:hypothetical protein n=1 Tax=Caballeronia calidae TaxID=1777139 RepID=UPI000AFFD7C3|nr:hypothetical protein [Caballeronia calidae]